MVRFYFYSFHEREREKNRERERVVPNNLVLPKPQGHKWGRGFNTGKMIDLCYRNPLTKCKKFPWFLRSSLLSSKWIYKLFAWVKTNKSAKMLSAVFIRQDEYIFLPLDCILNKRGNWENWHCPVDTKK